MPAPPLPNYTLPTESVGTFYGLFSYAHTQSGNLLGTLIMWGLFLIVLFYNLQVDGFKKRITWAFVSCMTVGVLFMIGGLITGIMYGFFVVGTILTVLWVGFTE